MRYDYPLFPAIEGDTMSTDFIPSQPGVSHLYPCYYISKVFVLCKNFSG